MLSIRAHRLSFSYSDLAPILADVELHLTPGRVGVVGPNGAGKTTLLRLITGELKPEAGAVLVEPADARVAVCPQTIDRVDRTLVELARGTSGDACRIRGSLRLDPASIERWATLSPGERKRFQIGAALLAGPDVLLLDEPTNHIDAEARGLLIRALRDFRGIGLIVSHDRQLLGALTTNTLRVDRGTARLFRGAYTEARAAWEAEERELIDARTRAREEERRLKRRLGDLRRAREQADADRSVGRRIKGPHDHDARSVAANTKVEWAADRISRSVAVVRRRLEQASREAAAFHFDKAAGRSVFVDYERAPSPWLFTLDTPEIRAGSTKVLGPVRLSVARDSRIRVEGPNGSGKTTLIRALLAVARVPPEKMLYVPQEIGDEEAQALVSGIRALPPAPRGRALSLLAALGVEPDRLLASGRPSPGEARKLMIATGLGRHVWALLLDEPTNHMDLPSTERLEEALSAFPGALLLVTHDRDLARRVADTTWRVECGAVRIASDIDHNDRNDEKSAAPQVEHTSVKRRKCL